MERPLDIEALDAFVAVAETQSFSRAADKLHLTQPAVSKRIAGLESALGTRLFDRIGRQVRLTGAGQELLPRAHALLLDVADMERRIRNLSGTVTGTLVMGTSHHIGLHRLPPVLQAYSRRYPGVQLDIRFMDSEVACAAVGKGDLELGIVTLPRQALPELHLQELWDDPLGVVVGQVHPLASTGQPLGVDTLLSHTAVLPAPSTFTRGILEDALSSRREALQVGMSTNYLETLKMLAATGLGWTLLPRSMLDADLVLLEVEGLALQRTLGIATHRRHTLSNAARAMITACEEVANPT